MSSEQLKKILNWVARECSETDADYLAIEPILKRRLLPLLQAGEEMAKCYQDSLSGTCFGARSAGSIEQWKDALKAILERP